MSRVGKRPIPIPSDVEVKVQGVEVEVKGPKGVLRRRLHPRVSLRREGDTIIVERRSESKLDKSLHGLTRTLVANMAKGVKEGFVRELELSGLGYRVSLQGKTLNLSLGFSHPMNFTAADGIEFEIDARNRNIVRVKGIDKQQVHHVAAELRSLRKPEPYKGKGIRYVGEVIRRKAGKAGV